MENSTNLWVPVLIVIVVVGFIAYFVSVKIKRRNSSWTGTVIDKNVTETVSTNNTQNNNPGIGITFGNTNAVNKNYNIRIKSEVGEEFNWPVGQGFYESVQVGDRLTKSPGTETPTKL